LQNSNANIRPASALATSNAFYDSAITANGVLGSTWQQNAVSVAWPLSWEVGTERELAQLSKQRCHQALALWACTTFNPAVPFSAKRNAHIATTMAKFARLAL